MIVLIWDLISPPVLFSSVFRFLLNDFIISSFSDAGLSAPIKLFRPLQRVIISGRQYPPDNLFQVDIRLACFRWATPLFFTLSREVVASSNPTSVPSPAPWTISTEGTWVVSARPPMVCLLRRLVGSAFCGLTLWDHPPCPSPNFLFLLSLYNTSMKKSRV